MDHTRILCLEAQGGRVEMDGILAMYICALNIQYYVHTGQALQRCLLEGITCISQLQSHQQSAFSCSLSK